MTDRAPPPHLELPSAALHASTHHEAHVDSEEAVQYERRRVSRELEPIYRQRSGGHRAAALRSTQTSQSISSLRSRNAGVQSSIGSHEHLHRQSSTTSHASTVPDGPGGSQFDGRSTRSTIATQHWYLPIVRFWRQHVSVTIDEGAHRDHLGTDSICHLRHFAQH